MRWILPAVLLMQASSLSPASVLHWTTKLMGMECDNRPVRSPSTPALRQRPAQQDVETLQDFTAERPLAEHGLLRLGICGGDVRILPNAGSAMVKIAVHVTRPLPKDLTPRSYLQDFAADGTSATMGWKLPEGSHPVFYVYVPHNTDLELQLGKGDVHILNVEGNKNLHVGKGEARVDLGPVSEYSLITVKVAMGSFQDLRPGGHENHKVPLKEELPGKGPYTVDIHVAMGKVVLAPAS